MTVPYVCSATTLQEFEVRRPGSRIQERTGKRQALLLSCHQGPQDPLDFESKAPDKVAILPTIHRTTMGAMLRATAKQFIVNARDKHQRIHCSAVPRWLQVQHFGWTDDGRYMQEMHVRTVQKLSQLSEEERVRSFSFRGPTPVHRMSPLAVCHAWLFSARGI
jgi:hypothetical protein